jgi:hypothetical protein
MPKTRAEKYELFHDVKISGSTSYDPQVTLAPTTEVEIVNEDVAFFKSSYHYVEVKDGVYAGRLGYLPKHALLECDVLQARVGLAKVATTGQRYGGSGAPKGDTKGTSFVAGGKGLTFELPFQGKEGCPHCGRSADQHTIDESYEARRAAVSVLQALEGHRNRIGGEFMIGVLKTVGTKKGRSILAVSDGFPKDRYADLETIAQNLGLRLIDRSEMSSWGPLRDCTGKAITDLGVARISIQNSKADYLQCAGPKLLQYLLHTYQTDDIDLRDTLFMSEIWYSRRDDHANYQHGQPAASCGKCAVVIPRMLCGYRPKR